MQLNLQTTKRIILLLILGIMIAYLIMVTTPENTQLGQAIELLRT